MKTIKRLTVTKDTVAQVISAISSLTGKQILVGIPDSSTDRESEIDGPMTNATLGYIHEFGSPEANIPARPFLIPGVQNSEDRAVVYLEKAAIATLSGDEKKTIAYLNDAGIVAMNGARNQITTGDFAPLSPVTIARRHAGRQTQSLRKSEEKYLELVADGMDAAAAQAATGIRPLINTGELRNSLTYVVTGK